MPSSAGEAGPVVIQVLPVNRHPQKMEKMNPLIAAYTHFSFR